MNFPVEENVDLLKLFKEAGSVVFFGSFTCQLEMMLIKLDRMIRVAGWRSLPRVCVTQSL